MFVFKLQAVLDYRKNIEEKIQNSFSEKKRELEREKLALKNLIKERVGLIRDLRGIQNKLQPVDDIKRHISYIEQIRENEKKQKQVIAQMKEELENLRNQLLEAVKKTKVMEKLKERESEEYKSAARALEQSISDEISVLKYGRREK